MLSLVLDPGHGGAADVGASTCAGVRGPLGWREKDLTLDLARRIRTSVGKRARVTLTRDADWNLSLGERARAARTAQADVFLSLHLNASADPRRWGAEVWTHPDAERASEALGRRLLCALETRNHPVDQGPLAVLTPSLLLRKTAACLVELDYLTHPEVEAAYGRGEFRQQVADRLVAALLQPGPAALTDFDVWNEVPLVHQTTGMSCWAAAAAMLLGWRDCLNLEAAEVARGAGRWEAYRDGLEPQDVTTLAQAWELVIEPPRTYSVGDLRTLLERYGPLWVGEASPGLHVVVVAGLRGDGSEEGTFVRVADPWPIGRGERYTLTFQRFAERLEAASRVTGIHAQVLHGDGRARGARRAR